MMGELLRIEEIPLRIEEEKVLRYQGYLRGEKPSPFVERLVRQGIERVLTLAEPRALVREFEIEEISEEDILLADGSLLKGANIRGAWHGAEGLFLGLCTIGGAPEAEVRELFAQGEYAEGMMLDSAASTAVSAAVDYLDGLLCREAAARGLPLGVRLSPGYGTWKVTEQGTVFRLLPGEEIGVSLNDSFMMSPEKSISFGVGFGPGLEEGARRGRCFYCGMESCPYRR
ncbi:MAG: vitamin B12 dependent-methionine synthase activation domain-containing protein [Nitrospinota bacterium]